MLVGICLSKHVGFAGYCTGWIPRTLFSIKYEHYAASGEDRAVSGFSYLDEPRTHPVNHLNGSRIVDAVLIWCDSYDRSLK